MAIKKELLPAFVPLIGIVRECDVYGGVLCKCVLRAGRAIRNMNMVLCDVVMCNMNDDEHLCQYNYTKKKIKYFC
jgi:hypothetical protein